jgi:pyrimidine-nucleoside phosphorylase
MTLRDAVEAKRDGRMNSAEELRAVAQEAAAEHPSWGQLGAWLMAAYLNGLDRREAADLTLAMAVSGERLDREGLPHPWLDKHSTGGVGDKTTIILLPLLAACGLTLIKLSGAGLGITGGTTDKLASIPGFRLDLSPEDLRAQAGRIGIALSGQTPRLAPADKTLYALRDATGTVASAALISASILSKKIAAGAECVVFDVKCGSGAFMPNRDAADDLARSLSEVGRAAGMQVSCLISEMDRPLGLAIGNALEVEEALETLAGGGPDDVRELCLELAREALALAGQAGTDPAEKLSDGSAIAKAEAWIAAQGGSLSAFRSRDAAPHQAVVKADRSGFIRRIDALSCGRLAMRLGAGRQRPGEAIDSRVGLRLEAGFGTSVKAGDALAVIHSASSGTWTPSGLGIEIGEEPPAASSVVLGRWGSSA